MEPEWIAIISGTAGGLVSGVVSLVAQHLSYKGQRKLKQLEEDAKIREMHLSDEIKRREVAYHAALDHWKTLLASELQLRRGATLQPFKTFLAYHMELANQKWSPHALQATVLIEEPLKIERAESSPPPL